MMLIEAETFPIVWMRYNQSASDDHDLGFAQFEALLAREQPFVLLGLAAAGEHDHTQEERKQLALWMKRNREALHAFVKAMVYIEPQPAKRFVAKASAAVFGKFWGYPMLVASSEEEALHLAERLLAGETPSNIDPERADA